MGVETASTIRPGHRDPHAHAAENQPFAYPLQHEYAEPDWTRLPGYRDVTKEQWGSAQWQRAHSAKNLKEFSAALGDFLSEELLEDIRRDQEERATMSMLLPPQMINTMHENDLRGDPVRRYMAPAFSEREPEWASHPMASRDSLHEADMWAVEGLTHRYPTKVLAELIPTCPQYCGHCTRMDLVGNDTLQVLKYKFEIKQNERWELMLDYLRKTPQVRDVVVSGGDMANVPVKRLEEFVMSLLDIEHIRDIRIATKGLMGIPQHFLQDDVRAAFGRMGQRSFDRGVDIAVHTHVNAAQQVTPLVGEAAKMVLESGFRDVRNQGVLLRGVNTTPHELLELCFALMDHAKILPVLLLHVRHDPQRRALADVGGRGPGPSVRTAGLHARLRDAPRHLRRAFRGQALGAHAQELRPHQGHLVVDEELPHRHRGERSRRPQPRVRLLRSDLHAARRGSVMVARAGRRGPARRALGRAGGLVAADLGHRGPVGAVLIQRQHQLGEVRFLVEVERPRQRARLLVALRERRQAVQVLDELEDR